MTLNVSSANKYNKNRKYSSSAIRAIQQEVDAVVSGSFDLGTAQRIYAWQDSSQRIKPLVADGKMGPNSLGTMIAEMQRSRRDTSMLVTFPHNLPSAETFSGGSSIILFKAITELPVNVRPFSKGGRTGVHVGGRFRVHVKFNPEIDCRRLEYRQFIKGTVTVTQGGTSRDASADFAVPGGLRTTFTEDGKVESTGMQRFGHRSATPVNKKTNAVQQVEDRYLPKQSNGHEYRGRDTYGLGILAPAGRPVTDLAGVKINMKITWQGRVIDTSRGNKILDTRHWGVTFVRTL